MIELIELICKRKCRKACVVLLLLTFFSPSDLIIADDGVFHPGSSGYARRIDTQATDLDYAKDFTVEALIQIEPCKPGGRWPNIIGKAGMLAGFYATVPGYLLGINQGHLCDFGQSIVAKVGDGSTHTQVTSTPYEGTVHAVMTWIVSSRTLTLTINGKEEKRATNAAIVPAKIKNGNDLVIAGPGAGSPLRRDVFWARIWNRQLSATEISTIWSQYQINSRHQLPQGFNRAGLLSEWLMDQTCAADGGPGVTHLRDAAGPNHLEIVNGGQLASGNGPLTLIEPVNEATGIHKAIALVAGGGAADLESSPTLPLQYFFQVDEVGSFDSPALKESGWLPHTSRWTPILKPNTTYTWRVKVKDSGDVPKISSYYEPRTFTTEGPTVWYARPQAPRGTYGREDGSSYENAFNGLSIMNQDPEFGAPGIVWGAKGVEAGDTLYICGPQALNLPDGNYWPYYGFIPITTNGFSEEYPVTIRSDHAEHPGIIWGFKRRLDESDVWIGPDENGVYHIARDLGGPPAQDIEKGLDGVVYLDEMTSSTWTGHPGAYYRDTMAKITYLKTTDGGDPTGRIYSPSYGYRFALPHCRDIRFKNCTFKGFSLIIDDNTITNVPHSSNITFDGCILRYSADTFIPLYSGNDDWKIINCNFMHGGNGVYTYGFLGGTGARNLTVRGNTFKHIGGSPYSNDDAHAIGIQRGEGHLIEHNTTEDTGAAVALWTNVGRPMRDITVRNNLIIGPKTRLAEGHGIAISGGNGDSLGERTGIRIYGNIIRDAEGAGITSNNKDPVFIANNVIVNCAIGIRMLVVDAGVSATVLNNVIVNPKQYFVQVTNRSDNHLIWDHNLYWPDVGQSSLWNYWGTYARWKSEMGVDQHSLVANPLFADANPIQAADFRPRVGSPMIDAGTDAGLSDDFVGTKVPQGKAPDIGAFEFSLLSPYQPADGDQNGEINDGERAAYAAAWREGAAWPAGPAPIPLDFLANAYLIYRNGGLYTYDPSLDPPECWKTVGTIRGLSTQEQTSSTRIIRIQPAIYSAGQTQTVLISVAPADGTLSWAFEETPPGNWSVGAISGDGAWDEASKKIRWGPFLDTPGMMLSYEAMPPGGETGSKLFQGIAGLDGLSVASNFQVTDNPVNGTKSAALGWARYY